MPERKRGPVTRYEIMILIFFYLFPFAPFALLDLSTPYWIGFLSGAVWIFVSIPVYKGLFKQSTNDEKAVKTLLTDTWRLMDRATLIFGKDNNQEYYDAWDRYREIEYQCAPFLNNLEGG